MSSMTTLTLDEFTKVLASKEPVPGGGGASALAGAVAVALGNMVGNLTVGKKKYSEVETEIRQENEKAEVLRKRFLALIDQDAEDFAPLAACYRLPAETQEEKAYKNARMEEALEQACKTPIQIMDACLESLSCIRTYVEKGSVMAVSDGGTAALLCHSALEAASLNIRINASSMKNRDKAEQLLTEMEEKIGRSHQESQEIYRKALEKLS